MLRILAHAVAIIGLYLTFSFALFLGLQVNPLYGNIGILACAVLAHEHLIKVPPPTRQRAHSTRPLLANLGGKDRAKTVPPEPDRLMAPLDPAFVEKILDIA